MTEEIKKALNRDFDLNNYSDCQELEEIANLLLKDKRGMLSKARDEYKILSKHQIVRRKRKEVPFSACKGRYIKTLSQKIGWENTTIGGKIK